MSLEPQDGHCITADNEDSSDCHQLFLSMYSRWSSWQCMADVVVELLTVSFGFNKIREDPKM